MRARWAGGNRPEPRFTVLGNREHPPATRREECVGDGSLVLECRNHRHGARELREKHCAWEVVGRMVDHGAREIRKRLGIPKQHAVHVCGRECAVGLVPLAEANSARPTATHATTASTMTHAAPA